jgi:hypothetical protein
MKTVVDELTVRILSPLKPLKFSKLLFIFLNYARVHKHIIVDKIVFKSFCICNVVCSKWFLKRHFSCRKMS